VRSGVRLYYEVFGDGPVTVLLLPAWAIVHSRMWKAQVPYLARRFRVITFDPRGNGRSDRPAGANSYADAELVADALAVLDAAATGAAVCVGLSKGGRVLLQLAAAHPARVSGAVFVAPSLRAGGELPTGLAQAFEEDPDDASGWAMFNAHYWRRDLPGFAEFFFGEAFPEAHSSRQIEDAVAWALETDGETLVATHRAPALGDRSNPDDSGMAELAAQVRCPSLVVHGSADRVVGVGIGAALAKALGCRIETFDGAGHCVQARHPVRFNLLLRQFVEGVAHART
jgi:pimeloyl-ACP methyl ester carboxylesterase